MPKKDLTLTSKVILALHIAEDLMLPFLSIKDLHQRISYPGSYDSFKAIFYRLQKRGLLKFIQYKQSSFIRLTKKGELEALLNKVKIQRTKAWDGKWRLFVFDIPEKAKDVRDKLRHLLKKNNFVKLQASVFISPYAFNREAIDYLKESKLIDYIRIMRVDEMDYDSDLLKRFNLEKRQ